jgi:hypothetical protein
MAIFPANATIIFEQPATASRIGINGTPETTTTPLIVVASLGEMVSRANSDQQLRDVDYFQIQLTGRAVTPKALPNTIKPGTTGQCLYWRLTSSFKLPESFASVTALEAFAAANEANIIQRGVFYLRADLGSKFKVQQILGDKITGSLTTQVAWDEVS